MKISLRWLQDAVTFADLNPQKIADAITAHTAEVESVAEQGRYLNKCCVGKLISVESHPNADRLSLCNVQTDKGVKRVVCGGTNLRAGMRVAFAHIGATVMWHGKEEATLEPVKIRGEQSEGMICAAEELGLHSFFPESVESIIIDLKDSDEDIGKPLKEYLGIDDTIIDIDNHSITHRPDLFSHIGFARECVAMGIAKWKKGCPSLYDVSSISFSKNSLPFKVHLEAKKLVPRYMACLLEIDALGETPEFIKSRIHSVGWRSINLPVDITNFVSTELGMPLHSFDADDFKGDIHMRQAKAGETITTLDEEVRELPEGALVISDDEGIFDLLGIMGGLRTSTTAKTRRIYLHSALVDPLTIRRTIIATGHRTEAATVYEKGIAPVTVEQGFVRALQLFLEYVPGARIVSTLDSFGDNGKLKPVSISTEKVNSLLGLSITQKSMVQTLEALGCNVETSGENLIVVPPLYRDDLNSLQDFIEEIGRIYGYNEIEPVMPHMNMNLPFRDSRLNILREEMRINNFIECVPLSLLGSKLLIKSGIDFKKAAAIENPIGEELSLMQPSVLPRLFEHASENLPRCTGTLRTFSIANVFGETEDICMEMGALITSTKVENMDSHPFYVLKRDICASLIKIGFNPTVSISKKPSLFAHLGACADIFIGSICIGSIFEVSPDICKNFDIPNAASAILNMTTLLDLDSSISIASPIPLYPAIRYDVTLQLSHSGCTSDLIDKLTTASSLLESVEIQDIYSESPKSSENFNLTLRFTYRSSNKTLTEEEAKKEHKKIMDIVGKLVVV